MKTKYPLSMIVLIALLFMTGGASAATPVGTGFTYQGKLTDGGSPANGAYDFEFDLYDALSGGAQVGGSVTLGDVTVTNGLFTVRLDFGDIFDGTALYLEINVRPGASVGAYTALDPRQQLTATPYSIYASKVPWSGVNNMPAGFADGVDNTGGTSYQNVKVVAKSGGDYTTITAALNSITDASPTNCYLIHVAPGVYTEQVQMKQYVDIEGSGELTTKITFTGNASPYDGTVWGANNAELRFLTVENTGGAAYASAIYNSSVSPRLTHVTAAASGGTDNRGVYNYSSSPTMTNVTASASGGTDNFGVHNYASSPTMTEVTATASGGTNTAGIANYSSSLPTMTNVTATASGGTADNTGVYNDYSSSTMTAVTASASGGVHSYGVYNYYSSPTMFNITATASAGTNTYGVYNYSSSPTMTTVTSTASGGTSYTMGVYNLTNSSPTMTGGTASASGGGTWNFGVANDSSSPTMTNITATATGGVDNRAVLNIQSSVTIVNSVMRASGGTYNAGLYNFASSGLYFAQVSNSQIFSGTSNTIVNSLYYVTRIGNSQLSGGAISNSGIVTCIGIYDEYMVSAGYTTCP